MSSNINDIIVNAVIKKPFYGAMAASMARIRKDELGTFGVTFTTRPILYYSQVFLDMLTRTEATEVMFHELLHLILLHAFRKNGRKHIPWNLACDIAVNEKLEKKNLPSGKISGFTIEAARKMYPDLNFSNNASAEEYYDLLMTLNDGKGPTPPPGEGRGEPWDDPEDGEGDGEGGGGRRSDKEKIWKMDVNGNIVNEDGSIVVRAPEDPEIINEDMVRKILKEMINTAKQNGNLPTVLQREIETLYANPQMNWRQMLKNYLSGRGRVQHRKTHMRESRRFPDTMGRRKQIGIKALVALDASGSVDQKEFGQFIGEIKGISKITGANIMVTQFDTEFTQPEPLERFIKKPARRKCGGTNFHPIFKLADDMQIPIVIIFTDGCAGAPEKVNQKVLWVMTAKHNKPADYGTYVSFDSAA